LVFAVVLGLVLVGGRYGLFGDPGTPWHLRLGREIIASGTVPRHDFLTYTRQGADWVDQSWGFDVLLAAVVGAWGWSAVVALTATGLAALYAAMARGLIRDGASPMAAIVAAVLAMAIGSIHFLARPHLFTFGFAYLTFRACQRQHERGGWMVLLVPLYTAVLANLHGGFVVLPLIAATAGLGHAISGPWDPARRREVLKFAAATVLSCLAALANPYGIGLYGHVANLLVSSGVTSMIVEYQPAPFGKPGADVLEWVLLGLIALPVVSSRRIDRYQLAHVLVWLHLALTTIRNAPFFAMAAAPALASLIDGLPLSTRGSWKRDDRASIWPALAVMALLIVVARGVWLGGYDPKKWPLEALAALDHQPASARLFHEQDWGGLIEAETCPVRRSYVDDRFELFGKEAIVEYVDAMTGGPVWDAVRDRDRVDLVWLRPDRGLAKRLVKESGWSVLFRDEVSILFSGRRAEDGSDPDDKHDGPPRADGKIARRWPTALNSRPAAPPRPP
jgi:hypothetical protein